MADEQGHRMLEQLAASVLAGGNALGSPLRLYLVQIILIVALCQVLGKVLQYVHQPKVIAEVLAGILLGPTALGAIPGFTSTLFPEDSLTPLKLTANLGLALFLFVVGMELDLTLINGRTQALISFAGQGCCWALSIPVSYAVYNELLQDFDTEFIGVVLFVGVAMSVTALAVLSRILSESRLLDTQVGATVMSAAAFDDLMGWSLLALAISVTGSGTPVEALYTFVTTIALAIFCFTIGKKWFRRLLYYLERRPLPEHAHEQDDVDDDGGEGVSSGASGLVSPRSSSTQPMEGAHAVSAITVTFCLWLALSLGYLTEIIGVSSIFGAFIAGLIVPRDENCFFTLGLTEKVEDVIGAILLPLYFAVSGLHTDFLKINTATMWGLAALVFVCACIGKICGAGISSYLLGYPLRESLCIGLLMNTRGLVELIILNAGLDAGVINNDVFSIMVLMAITTTFMTSPLIRWVYPPWLRKPLVDPSEAAAPTASSKRPALSSIAGMLQKSVEEVDAVSDVICQSIRLLVLLPDSQSAVYGLCRVFRMLLAKSGSFWAVRLHDVGDMDRDRFSATMRLQAGQDTVLTTVKRFHGEIDVKHHVLLVGGREEDSTPSMIVGDIFRLAQSKNSNMVLLPWRGASLTPAVMEFIMQSHGSDTSLDAVNDAGCTVACLVDRGVLINRRPHLVVPFRGGVDDRDALLLAMVMSKNAGVQLTVIASSDIEGVFYGHRNTGTGGGPADSGVVGGGALGGGGAGAVDGGGGGEEGKSATGGDDLEANVVSSLNGRKRSFSASQHERWSFTRSGNATAAAAAASPDVLLLKAVEGLGAIVLFAVDVCASAGQGGAGSAGLGLGNNRGGKGADGVGGAAKITTAPSSSPPDEENKDSRGTNGRAASPLTSMPSPFLKETSPLPGTTQHTGYKAGNIRRMLVGTGTGCDEELLQAVLDVALIPDEARYIMVICGRHGNGGIETLRTDSLHPIAEAANPMTRGRQDDRSSSGVRRGSSWAHRVNGDEEGVAMSNLKRNQTTVDGRVPARSPQRKFSPTRWMSPTRTSDNHDPLGQTSSHRKRAVAHHENRVIGALGAQLMHLMPSSPILVVRAAAAAAGPLSTASMRSGTSGRAPASSTVTESDRMDPLEVVV